MKVIMKKDVEKLGKRNEVVTVASGYARNYLLPQGLALPATPKNSKLVEEEIKAEALRRTRERRKADKLVDRLNAISCTIAVEAGEDDKLFGTVTSLDIAAALEKEGVEIDKRKIILEEPIRNLGIYRVPVKTHPEVTATVKVWVVRS